MIYLDFTATTKPKEEVIKTYEQVASNYFANGSSPYVIGQIASKLMNEAKEVIANTLKLENKKYIFTSCASEANNQAIYGICDKYESDASKYRIITSKIEHPSVYNCFLDLEKKGFDTIFLDVDSDGLINLDELKEALTNNTILVSIMWVNNIIGSIEPINEIINLVEKYPRCKFHVDCVQGLGKIKPDFDFNCVDLLTFSAHKINGLKGTGLLVINKNLELIPLIKGALQQENIRSGTMDIAGSCAMAKAIKLIYLNIDENYQKVLYINKYLKNKISNIKEITVNANSNNYSPYIINISIANHMSETIMHYLETKEIYVSIGSACNSKLKKPERAVLEATKSEERALTAIRISLASTTTIEEIDQLVYSLSNAIKKKYEE